MSAPGAIPRVLVVQNGPDGGPGRFGEVLTGEGLTLDVVHAYDGARGGLPGRLSHQALVVLGGGYLPDAYDRAPWLAPAGDLAGQALREGVPFFGICLGGQLLAQAAGGTVAGDHGDPEIGSTTVTLLAEAGSDPLFRGLPTTVTAIENHVDAITALPPDARWLARSERCPYQAFRVGESAWGVQFHPEATASRTRRFDPDRMRRLGFDPAAVHRRADRDEAASSEVWSEVARRFAAAVRDAST